MTPRKFFFIFILIQLVVFCQVPCQVPTIDVFHCINSIKQIDLDDITNRLTYIRLSDSNQTVLIGRISELTANDSYIIIYDDLSHKLLLYNHEGNFLRILMKQGKGPNEFIGINSIDINQNSEILVLFNSNQVAILNPDGNTREHFSIKGSSPVAKWLDDKKIVIIYPFPRFKLNDGFEISFVDRKGKVLKNAMPNSFKEINYNDMGPRFSCERNRDSLYYWNRYRDTVYSITQDMKLVPRITFKHSRQRYPIESIKKGAVIDGSFSSDIGYIQNSYHEFGTLVLANLTYKRANVCLVIDRINGTGYNIFYDYSDDHFRGFKNNLDGGSEFWPSIVTYDGDLMTAIDPNNFREAFLKNQKAKIPVKFPNQQDSVRKFVIDKITLMDNPILIKIEK